MRRSVRTLFEGRVGLTAALAMVSQTKIHATDKKGATAVQPVTSLIYHDSQLFWKEV